MPPAGPRSRAQQGGRPSGVPAGGANARNAAFESIFGRPAGGHHMGPGPAPGQAAGHGPPPAHGGYSSAPPREAYLNPAQPSLPPGHAFPGAPPRPPPPSQIPYPPPQPYVPAPPRGQSMQPPRQYHEQNGGPSQVYSSYQPQTSAPYLSQPNNVQERRASLAPSVYSNSSASYYSPTPDPTSPAIHASGRMTPLSNPAPPASGFRPYEPNTRNSSGSSRPVPPPLEPPEPFSRPGTLGEVPSPASIVFPRRPGASIAAQPGPGPSASTTSLPFPSASQSSSTSPSIPMPSKDTSRSPPPRGSTERITSPPPDYSKGAEWGFDGVGGGPLDDIPGIPKKGDASELGSLIGQFADADVRDDTLKGHRSGSRKPRHGSTSTTAPSHRRAGSDASMASSGYTMTSLGQRQQYMTPLSQIEPTVPSAESPLASPTTPTGSELGHAHSAMRRLSNRKSMDSTHSLPLPLAHELPPGAAYPIGADRSTSFSGSSASRAEAQAVVRAGSVNASRRPVNGNPPTSYHLPTSLASQRSLSNTLTRSASSARAMALRSMPYVYPALLSKVAEAFKQLINLAELHKDGITYKDSFDGRAAVSIIADIIKTPDRNLALLLGRALDAQKFFHDVSYEHRLRDNPTEIYQFKERLTAPFIQDGANDSPSSEHVGLARASSSGSGLGRRPPLAPFTPDSGPLTTSDSSSSFFASSSGATPGASSTNLTPGSPRMSKIQSGSSVPGVLDEASEDSDDDLPVGVFTLLTDCYSPTCSRESLCYSINCPRRLEQMKRLNMKPTGGLSRKLSDESLKDVKETGTLWIHSVSQDILDSVDDTEKKRQEAINEVIYTERDFVRDLEYLRDSWVKPLRTQDVIASNRREDFVRQVFWNVHDVLAVNQPLAEKLTKRQKQQAVVQSIGDIFMERVPMFEPFVTYGAHQLFGKYEFEKEKGANPAFQKFVDETERKPESRKLELNGYLTKPTTRLGRYPLLLGAVLKYTPEDHPDHKVLQEVIKSIKAFLTKVNIESGKSENIFELAQLEQQLIFRPNENIDLRLRDKSRELVHKGPLKRRGGSREEIADLLGFLFDHAFLLVKPKYVNKAEQYKVYRRPIPLELLVIITPDEHYNSGKLSAGRARLMARPSAGGIKSASSTHVPPKPESKHGFSITIVHLGKKGYSMQLWVDTYVSRKKWLEHIDKQQSVLRERSCVFVPETITEGYFHGMRKVNCVSPYDQGNRIIYGTDEGVYFSNSREEKLREPVKVINLLDVTQVDVIEEFQLLIVLHERSVTTFPLECLDPSDPNAALKRGKRISSHTSFFKSGVCLGKMLVAVVKSSTLSSTIKVLEPVDQSMRNKKQQGSFMRRLNGQNESLKLFKEFYIPTESSSIHFLKTKLCVGCTKGFEIVDLETLDMQGLLDPSDQSLDFVLKRDNVRPIAIYRIEEDFLLCYDEFAFYINKNGWRSRPKWAIIWEGMPTAFALHYPYVVAFEPTFIEVHHVETGHLVQIIPGHNIQCLFADTPPSRINAPSMMPNRQLMYPQPPPGPGGPGYRPPAQGYPAFPNAAPNGPYGKALPPGPGGRPMPPPMQGGYPHMNPMHMGHMAPPPMPRFARPQVIFTSDDGHVQFLKFPPPQPRSSVNSNNHNHTAPPAPPSIHRYRPSQ